RPVARIRGLLVHGHGPARDLVLGRGLLGEGAARERQGCGRRQGAPCGATRYGGERAEAGSSPPAAQDRAADGDRREERTGRERAPGAALRSAEGGRAAAALAARR